MSSVFFLNKVNAKKNMSRFVSGSVSNILIKLDKPHAEVTLKRKFRSKSLGGL